ncbi:T9SS type B sorting domain-containing protein [Robertkochia aurantiaca]|uniref:T9SS type B sorting domain-containing protein n=1 Tax=Robertkochia aurantiaca TaxID=2873700 RepID=UPI001CCE6B77|nr:T9SS type B sorting domain-containing protein [Robertkochia sp. 3YJGBD-33]
MHRSFLIVLSFLLCTLTSAQITLTHNVGGNAVRTNMSSCEYAQSWARTFTLSEFNISETQKFSINSGQVAIYNSGGGASIQFRVYQIDSNFPDSFSITTLIGSSQKVKLPVIGDVPEIIDVAFQNPIVIPDGTERIMVEVRKFYDINNHDESIAYISGTENDNDISWYWGCHDVYAYTNTAELSTPVPNANFFINITGTAIDTNHLGPEILLTHNACDDVIKTRQYTCSGGGLKFGRTFVLEDFGVSNNEEFIIDRAQVALSSVGVWDAKIQFNIYSIDDNFPDSYSEDDLIGSSQVISIPYFGSGNHSKPKVFDIVFGTPVVVPAHVDKILVEVFNLGSASSSGYIFIAGGVQNTGESWLRSESGGCTPYKEYISVEDPDINYYINVTGNTRHVTNNFEINTSNICSEFLKEFTLEPIANVASVVWDFGDNASGINNFSEDLSPFHDFTANGTYTITATITAQDGSTEVLSEIIDVIEPPNAYVIDNIYACEDISDTGISSGFDISEVTERVLGGQNNMKVTYIDGLGNQYDSLPNPYTNKVTDRETIIVRVAHRDQPCCYSETTFDLIVQSTPSISAVPDLYSCSNETDGFSTFDLQQVQKNILTESNAASVRFIRTNGNLIQPPLHSVENKIANEEVIRVQVFNDLNACYTESSFKLVVNPLPLAHEPVALIGCDDNNDGISEYFDTSEIESQVLNGQMGMTVSYFDEYGNELPSPLPNPYTNSKTYQETITVRVTNEQTYCFAETQLVLRTSEQPQINEPLPVYACNAGEGYSSFDISHIKNQIIADQTGLKVRLFTDDGLELPQPLPENFENTTPWSQTIFVRVENELNDICYAETSFDLFVNEAPSSALLESKYVICDLEPSKSVEIEKDFDHYQWVYENNEVISTSFKAELVEAGTYSLTIGKTLNGLYCENRYEFELIRSEPPNILEIRKGELSDNNFIEIIATGDGEFEYSVDGITFQESNYFHDLRGGNYVVIVRDRKGCGEDSRQINLVDYPKFFTPNQDGKHDYWHIYGIEEFPNSQVFIYDRYGKLLAQLRYNDVGWDGFFNGREMLSNDYWFKANLGEGTIFSGHFTLKR